MPVWSGSGEDLLLTVPSHGGEQREEAGALETLIKTRRITTVTKGITRNNNRHKARRQSIS